MYVTSEAAKYGEQWLVAGVGSGIVHVQLPVQHLAVCMDMAAGVHPSHGIVPPVWAAAFMFSCTGKGCLVTLSLDLWQL